MERFVPYKYSVSCTHTFSLKFNSLLYPRSTSDRLKSIPSLDIASFSLPPILAIPSLLDLSYLQFLLVHQLFFSSSSFHMLSMTMPMAMPLPSPDTRRRTSIPHLNPGDNPAPNLLSGTYLSDEERAAFIVASSTRRPSTHQLFSTPASSSPPCASYSSSSAASHGPGGISPILTPFQWTSDLRQYIMTDIGPQPSNSQMPTQRSHSHLVRQVSCSKISPVVGACGSNLSSSTTGLEPSNTATSSTAYSRYSTDLCTIPQDEVLPPMDVPLEKRFAHEEWDDEDE